MEEGQARNKYLVEQPTPRFDWTTLEPGVRAQILRHLRSQRVDIQGFVWLNWPVLWLEAV